MLLGPRVTTAHSPPPRSENTLNGPRSTLPNTSFSTHLHPVAAAQHNRSPSTPSVGLSPPSTAQLKTQHSSDSIPRPPPIATEEYCLLTMKHNKESSKKSRWCERRAPLYTSSALPPSISSFFLSSGAYSPIPMLYIARPILLTVYRDTTYSSGEECLVSDIDLPHLVAHRRCCCESPPERQKENPCGSRSCKTQTLPLQKSWNHIHKPSLPSSFTFTTPTALPCLQWRLPCTHPSCTCHFHFSRTMVASLHSFCPLSFYTPNPPLQKSWNHMDKPPLPSSFTIPAALPRLQRRLPCTHPRLHWLPPRVSTCVSPTPIQSTSCTHPSLHRFPPKRQTHTVLSPCIVEHIADLSLHRLTLTMGEVTSHIVDLRRRLRETRSRPWLTNSALLRSTASPPPGLKGSEDAPSLPESTTVTIVSDQPPSTTGKCDPEEQRRDSTMKERVYSCLSKAKAAGSKIPQWVGLGGVLSRSCQPRPLAKEGVLGKNKSTASLLPSQRRGPLRLGFLFASGRSSLGDGLPQRRYDLVDHLVLMQESP